MVITEDQLVPYRATHLPVEKGPWVVFAPHADDESFGMGGTLAKASANGIEVMLVIMTNGALGGNLDNLVDIRQQEATQAASLLGVKAPVFLGFPDRGLHLHQGEALDRITAIMEQAKPRAVYFPGCFELHPDHRTTTGLVWRALRAFQEEAIAPVSYEILVQSPVNCLVDISGFAEKKREVMNVYDSQVKESPYVDTAIAMNRARALTLGVKVSHAEGFYRFEPGDVLSEFRDVAIENMALFFQKPDAENGSF